MLAQATPGCVFYDVFAGTGIVGMEALSRDATSAVFVERDHRTLALLRRNLDRARFGREAAVRSGDAFVWARHFIREGDPAIVYLGPPYPEFRTNREGMLELVACIQGRLIAGDYLVLQFPSDFPQEELPDFEGWYRLRRYGKTAIGIWQPLDADADADADAESSDAESSDAESSDAESSDEVDESVETVGESETEDRDRPRL